MPPRAPRAAPVAPRLFSPTDFTVFGGLPVPDPITFIVGKRWLDRPNLYPRQATLIKVIFLREDLFTEYDYEVVAEWEALFRTSGENGINPGILDRMRFLRENGYFYFKEILLVLGRRAGKGYVSALAMSYVLWRFMSKGNPQDHYGLDPEKRLACFIYASKKQHAIENLWGDLANVIKAAPCFSKYIARPLGASISVYAPHDFIRLKNRRERGIFDAADIATFLIQPKESTMTSGRGPASFMQGYDEMAHQVAATGASRSAEEIYGAATPALDQFKKDAFIVEPSSPWQMVGQFYENWLKTQEVDENGFPLYPQMFMLQLASWEIYYDWEDAHQLPLFPEGFLGDLLEYEIKPLPGFKKLKIAVQEYDREMELKEKANPETFAVERRSKWQTTQDAYLNPANVDAMFEPWNGRELVMRTTAQSLSMFYKGHADPSLANANFAIAIGHKEVDEHGILHCVFDYIHHYSPSDFPKNTVDYIQIGDDIWRLLQGFKPDEFTYDQWNSAEAIQRLNRKIQEANFPKRVSIYEVTATAPHNWERAENFKVALNQGWIHAPRYDLAALELKYLQLKNGNKVVKQDMGPVQTKDVADAMMEVVWTILGEQVRTWTHGAMSSLMPSGSAPGGLDAYTAERPSVQEEALMRMGASAQRGGAYGQSLRGGGANPARNPLAGRRGPRHRS
jgi:hypothetical protein